MSRLKWVCLWALIVALLSLAPSARAQDEALRTIEALAGKYSGLKDYTADVNIHFDIETFKAPDLKARLYYKVPDKLKVESKRVLFFPKEGSYFNPALFKKEDFTVLFVEAVTHEGKRAVKLRLIPKKTKTTIHDFVLTIDTGQNQVREVDVAQSGEKAIKAELTYGTFGGFELPTRINLLFNYPEVEPEMVKGFDTSPREKKRVTGRVELTYSNYKVNSELRDEIFKETESPKP